MLEAANNESESLAFALKLQIQVGIRPQTAAKIARTVSDDEPFEDNGTQ